MKSLDLFCASQASTAICSSTDQKTIIRHGIRAIDRHIHRLGETPTRPRTNAPPCSSHLPFDPASYNKSRKSSSGKPPAEASRRKSCADADPPTSSRYLLSDEPFLDFVPDSTKLPLIKDYNRHNYNYKRMNLDAFPAFRSLSTRSYNAYESPLYNPPSSSVKEKLSDHMTAKKTSPPPSNHQVIELRVSIHCKGCEGKLRKHISRMEGVTSFSIDLATKKVTVIGDVTPVSVLTSISKVKNAQFWPSPASSSSSSSSFSSPSPRLGLSRS